MGLTRRSFLGLGASGLAVLALGGTGIALQATVPREPATALRALSPRAFSVLAAFADRVAPATAGFPSAAELHVAEGVDSLLATMDPAVGAELEQALLLFENALTGLLLDGRPRTFTSGDAAAQDAVIEAWRTSGLKLRRQVYKGLRGLVAAAYYGHPATYAAVGYPGPPDLTGFLATREAAREAAATDAPVSPEGGTP